MVNQTIGYKGAELNLKQTILSIFQQKI